jgi:hypothetical protein
MEGYDAPSRPAPISPQSSYGYHDLAKVALLAIFGVVITVIYKKLMADYFKTDPPITTGQPPRPANPQEIELETVVVVPPAGN